MATGLRPETFTNLQLNAGVFLANFDHSSATDAASLEDLILAELTKENNPNILGATRGGGSFQCTPAGRGIDADGKRYEFVGSTVNDGWTIKLSTTLLEVTPNNWKHALMSADVATDGNKTTITVRTKIDDDDYIDKLCWVGDTSKGYVMIELDNALNIAGASFTFTDKGEGTMPVEFQAHQATLTEQDNAPFRIIYFDEAAA